MATHSSILAWKIPWMEERVGHDWATSLSLFKVLRRWEGGGLDGEGPSKITTEQTARWLRSRYPLLLTQGPNRDFLLAWFHTLRVTRSEWQKHSTSTLPAAPFFVDTGRAEFSTGECDFLQKKKSRSSSKLKKAYFWTLKKNIEFSFLTLPWQGSLSWWPDLGQRDSGTHPWLPQLPSARADSGRWPEGISCILGATCWDSEIINLEASSGFVSNTSQCCRKGFLFFSLNFLKVEV